MGRLVDDLLAFSRLGRQPVNRQHLSPSAMVRQCWDELQPQRGDRRIEIHIDKLPDCRADSILLKQVWMNLLSNAIKYSAGRSPARIEVGGEIAGVDTPQYYVRDNGVGFDMRFADKLFGVFQRLHRAEDYEGTGVGLAIVQRIIHRHGGRVWAEARPNEGAAFSFTLPEARGDS